MSTNVINELDIYQMIEEISANHISRIVIVPALLRIILQQPSLELLKLQNLKYVFCSGEILDISLAKSLYEILPWVTLVNVYGSSEISADVTYYQNTTLQSLTNATVQIGKQIANIKCHVLDNNLNPLPIGGIGELYIGGDGLARGYLNRPDLTAEKFIANPFQTEEEKIQNKNTRLYKTGDLVRWLPDGNLEYIGRNDFQVKIRGYRIELGEIENALSNYDGVKQSVVIAKEHKIEETISEEASATNKYLVGYYVSESQLDEEDIINYLQKKLPEYMIPSVLMHLKELPLTVNGKLDRKALPEPEFSSGDNYVAPRNELEKQVCEIWANILGLTIDKVGIRDDFFRLGGNSIIAIRLVSHLNKKLNCAISLASIFKYRIIQELVHYLTHNTEDKIIINKAIVTNVEEQSLSFAQERLWFIEKYEEGTNAYNIPMLYKVSNDCRLDILESSIKTIVNRHEILRTLIKEDSEGNGYQVVIDDQEYPLEIIKISITNHSQLDQELEKQINCIFDLTKGYPIKVCLYSLDALNNDTLTNDANRTIEHYLSIVIHHIAFDGWSINIFLRELQQYYNYYLNKSQGLGSNVELPDLSIQYKDFALWQRHYLSEERLNKQLEYWRNKLEDYEPLNLISDKTRPSQISYQGSDIYFELDEDTSERLRELAKELKVSLYSVLLSGYYLMLRSYSNQDDIIIGTPVANRHYSQIENLIGFFVNSLALRVKIDSKTLVKEFIQKVGDEVIAAQLHQDLPFEKLVEELKIVKDTSRHPIFQIMFAVQRFGNELYNKTEASLLQEYITESSLYNVAKFDISTFIDDSETTLKGSFNYAVNLYTESTINRFIETYTGILKQLAEIAYDKQIQNKISINELNYLNLNQYQQIIYDWNDTDKEYPSNKTIHKLFEEQIERTPDNVAIIYEETQLTYRELNERVNQLASYLRQTYDIKPDTLIALCLDRSEHMLIAILAVLKAGGAYVPIDPTYPDDRINYILEDTDTKVILTNEVYGRKFSQVNALNIVSLDNELLQQQLSLQPTTNLKPTATSTNLIYVIYTSGTTGNPKGVMIEHRSILNRIQWMNNIYPLNTSDKILQKTPYIFDVSVWELLWANCYGACIVFAEPNGHKDTQYIIDLITKESITIVHFVPSMLNALLETLESKGLSSDIMSKLRYVFCSGEALSLKQVKKFQELLPNVGIYNLYGPTEASVDVLSYDCSNKNIQTILIGKAIQNTTLYVLDNNLNPLPIGAVGELYIGGVGLARGYLNKPELTTEKFIANPFQTKEEKIQNKNTRLYKTGDLVRWLPDGNLEYIGRNDFQVKIRGYRIELGEIENALSNYDGVKQSVVIAKEHKIEETISEEASATNKYLVGYYVSESQLDEEDIINYLQKKLPEYMIPSVLMHLKELPLTVNGKLDRKALPEPEFSSGDNYVAPRNELEKQVCEIWANILGLTIDKVGIRDDFFRLGGNSIIAIRLVSHLNKKLNCAISLASIFKYRTIQELVHYLTHNTEDKIIINKAIVTNVEEQSLSFAQERLWFIEKYEEGTNAYNIPMLYKVSNDCRLDILESSIKTIVNRHEILRTLIKEDSEGNGYQVVIDDQEYPLEIIKISITNHSQLDQELEKQINCIFDLTKGYPIKVCLYSLDALDNDTLTNDANRTIEHYLSIVIHHIAFDGWSINIFLRELQQYYNYYLNKSQGLGSNVELPDLSIQYKDFALWQRHYLSEERLNKQLEYWRNKLEDYEPLNLISDKTRPSQISYQGSDIYFELDEDTSERLRELAKELKVSLYSVLLSGYYLMLRSYSNQDDIIIGTPVANRHYSQIENLIGFFVNSLALRIKIDSKTLVKEFIQKVGDEVIAAQLHQDLPFEKLVEELKVVKDTSRHPIFQIMFEIQGFDSQVKGYTENNFKNLLQEYITESSLYNVAKFDISTFIDDSEATLKGSFNYAVNLYTEPTINRLIETYIGILKQLAEIAYDKQIQKRVSINELNYLNLNQYQQIIYDWNDTDKEYPSNKTIHQLFEEQVERTPDNIAIIYEETQLTYRELNERANQLASYLRQIHDIKPDTLIALCLDRSEHMLIAILAVLKAGGAYVPIDPSYPDDRVKYILEDTDTKVILTNEIHKPKLKERNKQIEVLAIDSRKLQKQLSLQLINNLNVIIRSTDLAYVIYTSGTTGNPKGVMIEHRNVINYIFNIKLYNLILPEDKVDFSTNAGFDLTVTTTICSLCSGTQIVIYNGKLQDLEVYKHYLSKTSINVAKLVPSYFESLIDYLPFTKLNKIILGGEKLSFNIINKLRGLYSNKKNSFNLMIWDEYGPTEATVGTCNSRICLYDNLTIGKSYLNYRVYILDNNLNPLPIGGIGELHIGGAGLARGYLNRPDLTAEKFIANPFQTEEEKSQNKNARLYKTGDLVRWLSDGNIEYIGRNDFQVKIRGYRIELGEIENVLSNYDGVKQSVVIAKERKTKENINNISEGASATNKYLVGYYVSKSKLDEEDIINYLQKKLPEYMIPSVLMHLKELPLTVNGKLDRKALPEPEFSNIENYVDPRNELEKQVCEIWANILGLAIDKVGIRDDFFRLGGDSIVSIQLVSRLRQKLNLSISIKDIFTYKTIERLYDNVLSQNNNNNILNIKTEQGILKGELELLPIQSWFFESNFAKANHWNQSFIIKTPSLDLERLRKSIHKLVEYHDSFRLRYKKLKNNMLTQSNQINISLAADYIQYYDDSAKTEELKTLNIKTLQKKEDSKQFKTHLQEILTNWQSNFDLEYGPLYSIGYIHGYADGSTRIFFALHHLIVDAVSWRILAEDLKNIYNGQVLGPKGSSYRQWIETVTDYASTHFEEKNYWDNVLADYDASSIAKLAVSENTNNYASFELGVEQTKQLLRDSNRAYNTQVNDILLTALGYALYEITGKRINHIILEGHGREEIDNNIDVTRTTGWFTTMYPVRLEAHEELSNSIKNTKESLRQIPNKGIGYGVLIGYKLSNMPRITFNYLGQFDEESNLAQQNLWNIVDENSGISINDNNQDYNVISINALVIDSKLQYSFTSKLNEKVLVKLTELLRQKLVDIMDYTITQTRSYLTISDINQW